MNNMGECVLFKEESYQIAAQPALHLAYKGEELQQIFRPDFVCYDKIIVEIKAVKD